MTGYKVTVFGTVKMVKNFHPSDMSTFLTFSHANAMARRYRENVQARKYGVLFAVYIHAVMFGG